MNRHYRDGYECRRFDPPTFATKEQNREAYADYHDGVDQRRVDNGTDDPAIPQECPMCRGTLEHTPHEPRTASHPGVAESWGCDECAIDWYPDQDVWATHGGREFCPARELKAIASVRFAEALDRSYVPPA